MHVSVYRWLNNYDEFTLLGSGVSSRLLCAVLQRPHIFIGDVYL